MYRFVGKKGKCYDLDSLKKVAMKLNYRCPYGKFVADSYKCGNTPEESKKNYESLHPEKGTKKVSKSKTPKEVKSVSSSIQKAVDKVKSGRKITKEEYDILKPLVEKSKSGIKQIDKSIDDNNNNSKLADSELIKSAYASVMNKLTEYTEKTNDYRSNTFNELIDARNELGHAYEVALKGNSLISVDRVEKLRNIDITNNIKYSLLQSAKNDPTGFIGISAIKQLRLMGLDSKGNDAMDLLTHEELNEYINLKPIILDRIRKGYEISGSDKKEKRFIELFVKKSLVVKEKLTKEKFISTSSKPLKNPIKFTYIDDNNNMIDVIAEEGTNKNAMQLVTLVATTPKILRGEGLTVILTTQRWKGVAAYYDSRSNEVVSLESDKSDGAQNSQTVLHELAHGLDHRGKYYSSTDEYNNVIKADNVVKFEITEDDLTEDELDMIHGFNETPNDFVDIYTSKDGNRYVSEYARSSADKTTNNHDKFSEDFAESVSFYFTDPLFKKVYPNRYNYIKAIVGMEGA